MLRLGQSGIHILSAEMTPHGNEIKNIYCPATVVSVSTRIVTGVIWAFAEGIADDDQIENVHFLIAVKVTFN